MATGEILPIKKGMLLDDDNNPNQIVFPVTTDKAIVVTKENDRLDRVLHRLMEEFENTLKSSQLKTINGNSLINNGEVITDLTIENVVFGNFNENTGIFWRHIYSNDPGMQSEPIANPSTSLLYFDTSRHEIYYYFNNSYVKLNRDGKSAYDLAIESGEFEGTLKQWLESLKGKDGMGLQGPKGDSILVSEDPQEIAALIVNDINKGGEAKILSAELGRQLSLNVIDFIGSDSEFVASTTQDEVGTYGILWFDTNSRYFHYYYWSVNTEEQSEIEIGRASCRERV